MNRLFTLESREPVWLSVVLAGSDDGVQEHAYEYGPVKRLVFHNLSHPDFPPLVFPRKPLPKRFPVGNGQRDKDWYKPTVENGQTFFYPASNGLSARKRLSTKRKVEIGQTLLLVERSGIRARDCPNKWVKLGERSWNTILLTVVWGVCIQGDAHTQ